MPLPPAISCFSKIQKGSAFLVLAYPGCPGKEAVKCVLLLLYLVSSGAGGQRQESEDLS